MHYDTGLAHLLRLMSQGHSPAWTITGAQGRHGIVVYTGSLGGGPTSAYCGYVTDPTMRAALAHGLVTLGEPKAVPEYEHGRGPWRHEDGQLGRPIELTEAGRQAREAWRAWR
ncbi:hypothetical protein [Streptomyces sp. NPDC058757]|uniref:hypothetical protein n=1 Tax=Streptomyces sp. NPDC058757 TaxID=3346626 RepID=UPI00367C59C5